MSDLPGQIGKYEIRRSLGRGAMGIVYEGYDPDIERRVAIKVLHPQLLVEENGEEFLQRFKREAQSAARCNHPNVVSVLEFGQDRDMPFIVMEFVEGTSLDDYVRRRSSISLRRSLSIVSQLLKALQAAHRLDIVHRDIKMANVMITRDGGIKLADFGIARVAERPGLTMTGAIVGTPKYMAPEQMFGLKVGARADLFSVTMLLVDLLACLPENLPIARRPLSEIANLPPNNHIDFSIAFPEALLPVLERGLAVKQEDRFASAREFFEAIRAALPALRPALTRHPSVPGTPSAGRPAQAPVASPEEFDSMTRLLIEYVGPVARNIMLAHGAGGASIDQIASEISKEIPGQDERRAFLERWQVISGTRIDSAAVGDPAVPASASGSLASGSRLVDDGLLEKVGDVYADYMGPVATRLVRYHSSSTRHLDELVDLLASEIPDEQDSREFREFWRREH